MGLQAPVRSFRDDVRERATTVHPELPSFLCHNCAAPPPIPISVAL
ncbi:hypothetical protein Lokhon_01572 [Limimaricola hongkongensis DSM 17492]|uniref:Uncharacterized protein n=1 Tax=Limimaricola hongkongensis DSM 17492 TaxID=1122180 RepID=A0A017HE19_9RHOB|nr:hypothetical protein Lokhon_01572 [Limimaricola hongkongensis DSM 17492]